MAEILTESFCERCGTRYTFESPRQRARLKGVKVLSRGLKNFVLSDTTSMDEAMAAARSETDREVTAHQLDAFHKTFNFCMSCRQYTCPDCWNEVEARCLSCAPHLGHEILPAPFPHLDTTVGLALAAEPVGLIPESDPDRHARAAETARSGAVVPDEGVRDEGVPAGPVELVDVIEVAPTDVRSKAAAQTAGLVNRFRPGQNLDAELDAYERDRSTALTDPATAVTRDDAMAATGDETTTGDEATAHAETPSVQHMPAEETLPTAEVAAASNAHQPVGEPAASAPTTPPPEVSPPSGDIVAQPTWQRVAPDPTPQIPLPSPVAAPTSQPASAGANTTAEPAWPAKPEWPTPTAPSAGLPFLGRSAAGQGGLDALWAESARAVVTPPTPVKAVGGVQPCVSCGLSLSATARFCRRCGTSQGS